MHFTLIYMLGWVFDSGAQQLIFLSHFVLILKLMLRDAFTWNPSDPDSEVVVFAKRTVKGLKLPPAFMTQIAKSIQPAIAFAIREQYEIAVQNVSSARESRIGKKGRRWFKHFLPSKAGSTGLDLMKLYGFRSSIIRKRKEWDVYEPVVDILSNEKLMR